MPCTSKSAPVVVLRFSVKTYALFGNMPTYRGHIFCRDEEYILEATLRTARPVATCARGVLTSPAARRFSPLASAPKTSRCASWTVPRARGPKVEVFRLFWGGGLTKPTSRNFGTWLNSRLANWELTLPLLRSSFVIAGAELSRMVPNHESNADSTKNARIFIRGRACMRGQ